MLPAGALLVWFKGTGVTGYFLPGHREFSLEGPVELTCSMYYIHADPGMYLASTYLVLSSCQPRLVLSEDWPRLKSWQANSGLPG